MGSVQRLSREDCTVLTLWQQMDGSYKKEDRRGTDALTGIMMSYIGAVVCRGAALP